MSHADPDVDIYYAIADRIKSMVDLLSSNLDAEAARAETIITELEKSPMNIFTPYGIDIHQQLDRMLRAMLLCAPEEDARRYVVEAVLACAELGCTGDPEEPERHVGLVRNLRSLAITWLTLFLFLFKPEDKTTGSFSEYHRGMSMAIPAYEDTEDPHPTSTGRRLDRGAVHIRDGRTCVISGNEDNGHPSGHGLYPLRVAHIVKRSAAEFSPSTRKGLPKAAVTFDILRKYVRLSAERLETMDEWVDHPSNMLLVNGEVHNFLDDYRLWLVPALDGPENHYRVIFASGRLPPFLDWQREDAGLPSLATHPIDLSRHGGPEENVVNPIFIAVHATMGRVLHLSGVNNFSDKLLGRYTPFEDGPPVADWEVFECQVMLNEHATQHPGGGLAPLDG